MAFICLWDVLKRGALLCLLLFPVFAQGQPADPMCFLQDGVVSVKNRNIFYFEDKTNSIGFQHIQTKDFKKQKEGLPNFGFSKSTYWMRFTLTNVGTHRTYLLRITNPNLDSVVMYLPGKKKGDFTRQMSGTNVSYQERLYPITDILFNLQIPKDSSQVVYLRIRSKNQLFIPIYVADSQSTAYSLVVDYCMTGLLFGILLIMIIYNLFLYLSTRDFSYFLFVLFLLAMSVVFLSFNGIGYQYIWHNSRYWIDHSTVWSGILSGIVTGLYAKSFLELPKRLPVFNNLINGLILLDVVAFVLSLFSLYYDAYQLVNVVAVVGSLVIFIATLILTLRKYRPALFFLIGFSAFLLSVVFFVVGSYTLLPSEIRRYSLQTGATLAVALFSFALADKINVYRKEKEESQKSALEAALEKEYYISQQNTFLENQVKNRTRDLEKANKELTGALNKLKNAQSQLVEAEKMSSLGQLTAGIAHEINNPINFIKSNLRPLSMDIKDLTDLLGKYEGLNNENLASRLHEISSFKEEIDIDYLLKEIHQIMEAMEDGTERTAEIVKGLRIFSHVDEDDLKEASINRGLSTTLTLLKSSVPDGIEIRRNFGEVPKIECYPGKLNQVFMNLLNNALQAVTSNHPKGGGILSITTRREDDKVVILIEDNGPGIPESIRSKIYDPFFTTKKIGEGTGLGLSISYGIVKEHKGTIELTSEEGKGTTFKITLPVKRNDAST